MKYSFIIPYWKREELHNTLVSFNHHYKNRDDFEVVIVEDIKNTSEDHDKLLNILNKFSHFKIRHTVSVIDNKHNPGPLFNIGSKIAEGEYFIITNPECFHKVNVLEGFDNYIKTQPDSYIVCSCLNIKYQGWIKKFEDLKIEPIKAVMHGVANQDEWYQHSKYMNRRLHFCALISKLNYNKIDGFDERYTLGLGWEDNDFLLKIITNNIKIITDDNLLVLHLQHLKEYQNQYRPLYEKNHRLYTMKWGVQTRLTF